MTMIDTHHTANVASVDDDELAAVWQRLQSFAATLAGEGWGADQVGSFFLAQGAAMMAAAVGPAGHAHVADVLRALADEVSRGSVAGSA